MQHRGCAEREMKRRKVGRVPSSRVGSGCNTSKACQVPAPQMASNCAALRIPLVLNSHAMALLQPQCDAQS